MVSTMRRRHAASRPASMCSTRRLHGFGIVLALLGALWAVPGSAVQVGYDVWDTNVNGAKNGAAPTHTDIVRVFSLYVSNVGSFVALQGDGTLVSWAFSDGTTGGVTVPSGTFVDLNCSTTVCLALKADGTLAAFGDNLYGQANVPGGLSGVVSMAQAGSSSFAVKSDGTVVEWGQDFEAGSIGPGYVAAKALTKVRAMSGAWSHFTYLQTDGTVHTHVYKPGFTPSDLTPFDAALGTPPAGLVATQVACGYNVDFALKQDGTVAVWGYNAAAWTGKFAKKVRRIITSSASSGVYAILVDGTLWRLYQGTVSQVKSLTGLQSGVLDFSMSSTFNIAATTTSCFGVGWEGCCSGDVLQVCNSYGSISQTVCNTGTCGWSTTGGAVGGGGYDCSTTGTAPVSAPPKACCVPSCAGKNCGDDGCGGVCGSCAAGKVCDASQLCACPTNCDDGLVCTNDDCNSSGTCVHVDNSATCSTNNLCTTGGDHCQSGACAAGPIKCDDGNPCTTDACKDAATGCVHTAVNCDDGNLCTDDACDASSGNCKFVANKLACNDGNACTSGDACSSSICAAGTTVSCDDGNACTDDSCSPADGCHHTANTAACDDVNACTVNDACSDSACSSGPLLTCNDNNPCTTDSCDAGKGCVTTEATGPCNAGSACTTGDTCAGGKCQPGSAITCDDGNACTSDGCDAKTGCTVTNLDSTTGCDDGNSCTNADHCQDGKCTGTGTSCDDNNSCTTDNCDGLGSCTHTTLADGDACDDGDACTTTGKCSSGTCGGILAVNCDDANPCTLDSCDKSKGCQHANSTGACDDGNPCTTPDTCQNGLCQSGAGCSPSGVCVQKSGGSAGCVCKAGYVGDGTTCTLCVANCTGKYCGSDGCGGSCGTCAGGFACDASSHCTCAPKCSGKACGPDGCGGSCGGCGGGETCNIVSGTCSAVCVPECQGKLCGPDGCGGSCGNCASGQFCMTNPGVCRWNTCPSTPPSGCCTGNMLVTCDQGGVQGKDCSATSTYCDWDAKSNSYGCVASATGADPSSKNPRACSAVPACVPDCSGKTCGPDGCGGTCGDCGTSQYCNFDTGTCHDDPCAGIGSAGCCSGQGAVTCDAKSHEPIELTCGAGNAACGWDGAAYTCGHGGKSDATVPKDCPANLCIPTCSGKNCGSDGCGGFCGACSAKQTCNAGVCCTPSCSGKNCGPDGCGGTCGTCGGGLVCNAALGHCMGADQCQGAPFDVGCCDGQTLKVCQKPFSLASQDCTQSDGRCGWDAKLGRYGCGTLGGSDPKGKPKLCKGSPACVPDCTAKSCGPDGCGGTCPNLCQAGESCTKDGTCTPSCGDLSSAGCCTDGKVYYCGHTAATGAWAVQSIDCKAKGMDCGFAVTGSYSCVPGKGSADPSGALAMTCPASVFSCQANCAGKACGPDGCGGQCGQCQSYEKCEEWSGTCYVPPPDCQGLTWKGQCDGSQLSYCSASSQLVQTDCGAPKEQYNGTNVSMCKWNGWAGAYGCYSFLDQAVSEGYNSCKTQYENLCGKSASYYKCQCDIDCEARGDCCADFHAQCSAQLGIAYCGDGTCNTSKGEGCATCAADCQALCQSPPVGTQPPWPAPFAEVLAMKEKPSQHAEMPHSLLDNVLPSEPPVPQKGLLAWLPARGAKLGAPGTHAVFGNLGSGSLVDAPGKQGPSLGLLGAKATAPSGGVVRVALEQALPKPSTYTANAIGGLSLAFWVKVPTSAPDIAQPLASTFGPGTDASESCAWSRPADSAVTVDCGSSLGAPNKIVGIYGYYGAIDKAALPEWNVYYQGWFAPHGMCAYMDSQKPKHTCEFSDIQPWLETLCLGKSTCHIDPWTAVKDPCVSSKDPNIQSTLMVHALCAASAPASSSYLAIDDAAGGHRLRYEVPGLPAMTGTSDLSGGGWHHVALVHRPFMGGAHAGVTTLYVDGQPEAESESLVPPTFWQLWLGAAVVAGTPKSAPNLVGSALAAVADLDDVFLYERALSAQEVRALMSKPDLHLVREWPPVSAEAALEVPSWQSGGTLSTVQVEAPQLLGPMATTQGSTTAKLHTENRAVHVPASATFAAPVATGDLTNLNHFSLVAWIRWPTLPAPGAAVLRLMQGNLAQVAIRGSAACGGGALTATVNSSPATQVQACEHALAAGRWSFVSLVQDGANVSLRIDGHEIGTGTGSAILLPGNGTATSLEFAGEVDVFWAGLFDEALTLDTVQRWRSEGPAVWSDAAHWDDNGTARLRDYADFRNETAGNAIAGLPSAWTADGKPAALAAGGGPLVFAPSGPVAAVTVPATGRFGHDDTGRLPFSWSAHVQATGIGGSQVVLPLVEHRGDNGAGRPFAAQLACKLQSAPLPIAALCRMEVLAEGPTVGSWASAQFPLKWPSAAGSGGLSLDLDVALAWDGTAPHAAVGARGAATPASHAALSGQSIDFQPFKVNWPTAPPAWPTGTAVLAMTGPDAGLGYQIEEFRFYPRALVSLELAQLVRRTCSEVSCGSRDCLSANDAALPACGPCDAGHFEAGDKMGDTCLLHHDVFAACTADEQCNGICQGGRCQDLSASDACKEACGALKRTCVGHADVVHGTKATVYGCSADCVKYFTPPPGDVIAGKCLWTPSVADHGTCDADEACISGKCIANETPTFDGGIEGGTVCAYASPNGCTNLHRSAVAYKGKALTGKPIYTCAGCATDVYQGQPLWQESYSLLTPAACTLGTASGDACISSQPVKLACLASAILGKTGAIGTEDISKLRAKGVGPNLLSIAQAQSVVWPDNMALSACSSTNTLNEFHWSAYNHPQCVGHQYPLGTTCPPPGATVAAGQESEFCESGFCARDTHKCEVGYTIIEDTKPADRQDQKSSQDQSNYGPLTVTQTNRASLQLRKQSTTATGSGTSAAAPKRDYTVNASVTHAASIFGSSSVELTRLALTLHGQMDDKKAQFVPHLFIFGMEEPKVVSMVPPSNCTGQSWKDGELDPGDDCPVTMNAATMTPTLPTIQICPPIFKGCEESKSLPPGFEAGPTCIKRSTFVGPVPMSVEASARVEICFELGLGIDSQTLEPGFKAGPSVDIGVEVKGGVGVDQFVTVFAGVKAALSLLKLGFPVTWALKVEQEFGSDGTMLEGFFKVKYGREVAIEATMLRLALSLFAEVGLGWFKLSFEYPVYAFGGLDASYTLGGKVINEMKLDLANPLADQP